MKALMDELRIPRYQAVGIVESLIHFTGSYARLGDIGRWSDEQIANSMDWPSRRAGELIKALLDCGWIDLHTDPSIRLIVHDWQEHADDTTKKWVARSGKQFVCPDTSGQVQTCHDMSRPPLALSQSQNQSQSLPDDDPPERASSSADSPVVLSIPVVGNGANEWELRECKVAEYQATFPHMDVIAECRKARQWCIDNPARRKTFGGMPAFLGRWLAKAQNAGGGAHPKKPAETKLFDSVLKLAAQAKGK